MPGRPTERYMRRLRRFVPCSNSPEKDFYQADTIARPVALQNFCTAPLRATAWGSLRGRVRRFLAKAQSRQERENQAKLLLCGLAAWLETLFSSLLSCLLLTLERGDARQFHAGQEFQR